MLKQVTGRFGPESFRPGSFWPGSIQPWVVSAQFGGSFRPIFSRSHICELNVYEAICRPSSVRLSKFSNDISSEAVRPILFIFHI